MGSVKGSQDEYRTPYLILFNGMSEARIALERGEYQRAKGLLRRAQERAEDAFGGDAFQDLYQ